MVLSTKKTSVAKDKKYILDTLIVNELNKCVPMNHFIDIFGNCVVDV